LIVHAKTGAERLYDYVREELDRHRLTRSDIRCFLRQVSMRLAESEDVVSQFVGRRQTQVLPRAGAGIRVAQLLEAGAVILLEAQKQAGGRRNVTGWKVFQFVRDP